MATDAEGFMASADDLLRKLEESTLVSKKELEAVRKDLVRQIKAEAKEGAKGLGTMKIGSAKVLVPTSPNLRKINLISERVRQRTTDFKLNWLDKAAVKRLKKDGTLSGIPPGKFIRHSRRLARHAREFLNNIGELEPDLQEEIDAALLEIADNELDIIKLNTKSWTRMKETLLRGVNGRTKRGEVVKQIDAFDINRSLWNLSLLEHPKATVQQLLASSSERMAERVTTSVSQLPKRAHVLVGVPPVAQSKMTPKSRTAKLAWRLFSVKKLTERFENLPKAATEAPSSWRGLGLDYNTPEWYVPVPPEIVDPIQPILRERRKKALEEAERIRKQSL